MLQTNEGTFESASIHSRLNRLWGCRDVKWFGLFRVVKKKRTTLDLWFSGFLSQVLPQHALPMVYINQADSRGHPWATNVKTTTTNNKNSLWTRNCSTQGCYSQVPDSASYLSGRTFPGTLLIDKQSHSLMTRRAGDRFRRNFLWDPYAPYTFPKDAGEALFQGCSIRDLGAPYGKGPFSHHTVGLSVENFSKPSCCWFTVTFLWGRATGPQRH